VNPDEKFGAGVLHTAVRALAPKRASYAEKWDKITGTVVKPTADAAVQDRLRRRPEISWAAIQDLSSDKKLFVATPDQKLVSGAVTTQDADLVITTAQGGVHVPKASAGLIRSEGEQAAYEASLHPALTRNWAGGLNLGFALARGNSETQNVNLGFNAVRPTSHDKITLYADSIYSTNDKLTGSARTTANTILGGLRYDHIWRRGSSLLEPAIFRQMISSISTCASILGGGLGFPCHQGRRHDP